MQKDILLANTISKDLSVDYSDFLDEYNYKYVFEPLDKILLTIEEKNTLICAIIYSYSPNSNKIDLKQDGQIINQNILKGLGVNTNVPIYKEFIAHSNPIITETIANYFDTILTWQYITIRKEIDYAARYVRVSESDEDFGKLDGDKLYKARFEMGRLIKESVAHRQTADLLIDQMKKEHMITDERVKNDFGISFVDESIKRDFTSWHEFVFYDLPIMKQKRLVS